MCLGLLAGGGVHDDNEECKLAMPNILASLIEQQHRELVRLRVDERRWKKERWHMSNIGID